MSKRASKIATTATGDGNAVRKHAEALRVLLAYSYAAADSVELRQAVDDMRRVLPAAGFSGPAFEDDEPRRQQLRASFDSSLEDVVWMVPRDVGPLSVTSIQVNMNESRQSAFPVYSGDAAVAFWFSVAQIVQQTLPLLGYCPGCSRKFVRSRPDSTWCSKACGQRVRTRRWYAAHREEAAERKHEAYVARRKQTHGKAKVARRPRVR